MTPEEFLSLSDSKQLSAAVGPGLFFGAAGALGVRLSNLDAGTADEVLTAAMTPVAVLAAAALVILHGAVSAQSAIGGPPLPRHEAIALMSGFYLVITTLYFCFSLATLSVSDSASAKADLAGVSFGLLGLVLGSMLAIAYLLFWFLRPSTEDGLQEEQRGLVPD